MLSLWQYGPRLPAVCPVGKLHLGGMMEKEGGEVYFQLAAPPGQKETLLPDGHEVARAVYDAGRNAGVYVIRRAIYGQPLVLQVPK